MGEQDRQQFQHLVERIETQQIDAPQTVVWQRRGLILLGAVVQVLGLALLIGLLVLMFGWFVDGAWGEANGWLFGGLCVVGAGIVGYLRAMWVRLPPPEGLRLTRHMERDLRRMIAQVKEVTGGPKVDQILLTPEATAAMGARPLLGLWGPVRHHLVLGLPMLAGLSPEHLRALLAHEFAHMGGVMSRTDEALSRTLYRWRAMAEKGRGRFFGPFTDWYLMRLTAHQCVASRTNEVYADQAAVALAGARTTGEALLRTVIVTDWVNVRYWKEVYDRARDLVTPPSDAISGMIRRITEGEPDRYASTVIERALRDRTNTDDTHPCLSDRLAVVGWPGEEGIENPAEMAGRIPGQPDTPALAEAIPPAARDQAISLFDQAWVGAVAEQWTARHSQIEQSRTQLAQMTADLGDSATAEDLMDIARLRVDANGVAEARADLDRVLAADPNHGEANYLLGEHLLGEEDAAGAGHLQRVVEQDPQRRIDACQLLYGHYRGEGDLDRAEHYRALAEDHAEAWTQAGQEMSRRLGSQQYLREPRLRRSEVDRMQAELDRVADLGRVWACRVVVNRMPDLDWYLLIVQPESGWWHGTARQDRLAHVVADSLSIPHPFIVLPMHAAKRLIRPVRRMDGALVYERP